MKIAIDLRKINDKVGISTVLKSILESMILINRENYHFFLLINKENDLSQFDLPQNVTVLIINAKPFSIQENWEIPFLLKKHKVDLYHSTHFNLPLFMFVTPKTKILTNIYDLIPYKNKQYFNLIKSLYFKVFFNYAVKQSHKILTISEKSKKEIISIFKTSAPKVEVVYCCLMAQKQTMNVTKARLRQILFVGAHYEHKNIISLIRAMKILTNKGIKDIKLITAGTHPPYIETLQIEVSLLGLQDCVHLMGAVSIDVLSELYQTSELFVFPSLEEGFGLPPIEAMFYGLPVISSNKSVMPEIIADAGILVDPTPEGLAEKIELLIDNKELKTSLVQKGFERIKTFSLESFASKLFNCYQEILEG